MKRRNAALLLVVAGIVAVWVLCLIPLQQGAGFEYKDKIQHLAAYLLQTGGLAVLFPRHRGRVLLGFLVQGAVIEGLQALTPYRSAELADMLANSAGAVLGLLLALTPLAGRLSVWLGAQPSKS